MRLPDWLVKMIGKKVVDGGIEKTGISKAKLTAIVGALVLAYQQVGPAFNLPPLPPDVFKYLEMFGLWSLRDAVKS